jgi:predicted RNase H-like HicB family nuclease
MTLEYPVIVQPLSPEDGGGFLATVPDFPGCMSDGETPEEAIANVQDAIAVWIEAARELGRGIPEPSKELHALNPKETDSNLPSRTWKNRVASSAKRASARLVKWRKLTRRSVSLST